MTVERIFFIFVLWLACFIVLPSQFGDKSRPFQPEGPDAFMRLERVDKFVETGNWYDSHIDRAGPSGGADIHWTRPMDVMILAVAAPLLPFMDTHAAIELAGVFLPALMSLLLVIFCVWAVMPLMQPSNLLLVVFMLAVQPIIQNYLGIGRVDHHAVLAVLMAAVLGVLIRVGRAGKFPRAALVAGALSGFGLWISLEFLIVYVPLVIGLGVCWLLWGAPWRQANRDFTGAALAVCLIAVAVDVPPDLWLVPRYDRISIAQIFLTFCPALFWLMGAKLCNQSGRLAMRIIGAGIFAVICLAAITVIYPNLLVGPMAEADPRIVPIWLDKVSEMKPLFTSGRQIVLYCLLPFAALIYGGFILVGRRHPEERQTWLWLVLVLLGTGLLALAHIRAGLYLSVAAVIAAAPLLEDLLIWVNEKFVGWKKGLTGLTVRAAIILGPFLLALAVGAISNGLKSTEAVAAVQPEAKKCDISEVAAALSDDEFVRGRGMLRFVNNLDAGPELVYRTAHHFLAVPYHRNGQTIYDSHEIFTATDFDKSRDLLDKYDIDYILICPSSSDTSYFQESENASNLYNRLVRDDLPKGLVSIKMPAPWKLFAYKVAVE